MGTPSGTSLIWGTQPGSTAPAVDPAVQQDANFNAGPLTGSSLYRGYLDSQIRGLQTHVVQSLVGGLTGSWYLVDPNGPAVQKGQWVCLAGSLGQTVTPALLSALVAAGLPLGIALTAGGPGTLIRVALGGMVPPGVTGLIIGTNVLAAVNTATAFTQTKATLGTNDYPVGAVDAAANLAIHISVPPVNGSGGGLTVLGSGFIPVVSGVIGANARAVNLASNAANGDVTGLLGFVNGGRMQGDITVTHASPGTFDASHQIAYCQTSTGTCSITFPPASAFTGSVIPSDWTVAIIDTDGQAATSNITVNPNSETFWSPSNQSFGTSNETLTTNGIVAIWQWDSNRGHWVLLSATNTAGTGGGGTAAPVRKTTANTGQTLARTETNVYANTTGGLTLTMFGSPADGMRVSFYDDHLLWISHNLTITANSGQKIWNPATGVFSTVAGSIILTNQVRYVFEWDNTLSQWGPG